MISLAYETRFADEIRSHFLAVVLLIFHTLVLYARLSESGWRTQSAGSLLGTWSGAKIVLGHGIVCKVDNLSLGVVL